MFKHFMKKLFDNEIIKDEKNKELNKKQLKFLFRLYIQD